MAHIHVVNSLPSSIISIENENYLFFSGTNYLGIAHDAGFQNCLFDAFKNYGSIYSASRNNNLRLAIYEAAETNIATEYGFEAAVLTSSGIFAGQLAMNFLKEKKIIYCPSVHPAIKNANDNKTLKIFNTPNFIEELLEIIDKNDCPIVIATNTIDNITCEKMDFDWLNRLPINKKITLLFDYSHGIGLLKLNENIEKAIKKFDSIVIASLAKAIGIPAGIILSTKNNMDAIKSNSLFAGASPPIPSYIDAYLKSAKLYNQKNVLLQKNINYFERLNNYPFQSIANFPVYATKNNIFEQLFKQKIFVSHFSYPTPQDLPLSRIVLSAAHTFDDIEQLTNVLNEINNY